MLQQHLASVETKSLSEDKDNEVATFTGAASTADKDLTDDIIEAGAFGTINVAKVALLRDHSMAKVIGKWRRFEQNGKRLDVEGEIGLDTALGLETYKLMKRGYLSGLSVGFLPHPKSVKWDHDNEVRYIKSATLLECSIVAIPANPDARMASVKSFNAGDWRQWLIDNGVPERWVDTIMTRGFDALLGKQKVDDEPPEPKANESREAFMSRCMRAGSTMTACAAAWKDSENGNGNGNGNNENGNGNSKRLNITGIDGYEAIDDSDIAALANEAKRFGELLRGKAS